MNSVAKSVSQGQSAGRCNVILRAEVAIRAATVIRVRRIRPVVAFASRELLAVAVARVRLNAITASTNHALFAAKDDDGK